ncbi:unnamed protein product, partial [Mycena citricolor]
VFLLFLLFRNLIDLHDHCLLFCIAPRGKLLVNALETAASSRIRDLSTYRGLGHLPSGVSGGVSMKLQSCQDVKSPASCPVLLWFPTFLAVSA